jgi:hypothetical protein
MRIALGLEPPIQERSYVGWDFAADQVSDDCLKPGVRIANEHHEPSSRKRDQQMHDQKLIRPGNVILKIQSLVASNKILDKGFIIDFVT